MVSRPFVVIAIAALAFAPTAALAKDKAKPKPRAAPAKVMVTQNDIRICMGVDGSTPDDQIVACSKILATGKVKHPYEGDYYATRAAAYFEKGMLDNALADLNKAISVRQTPEFYFQRGLVHLARREIDAGKKDLEQVIKLKPDFPPAYLVRGIAAYNADEYADALTYFESAVKRNPTYYQALFARGVAKKKTGDAAGGEKDIAAARGMSPKVDADLKRVGLVP